MLVEPLFDASTAEDNEDSAYLLFQNQQMDYIAFLLSE